MLKALVIVCSDKTEMNRKITVIVAASHEDAEKGDQEEHDDDQKHDEHFHRNDDEIEDPRGKMKNKMNKARKRILI